MLMGAALAWSLVDAGKVIRQDGSKVILMKHPTWQSEVFGLWEVIRTDYYIILFFPLFFSSNFFYTYHFNDVNLARFTLRTRALNGLLYWTSQIFGALVFGYALDIKKLSRTNRARALFVALLTLTMGKAQARRAEKGYNHLLTLYSHLGRRLRIPEAICSRPVDPSAHARRQRCGKGIGCRDRGQENGLDEPRLRWPHVLVHFLRILRW